MDDSSLKKGIQALKWEANYRKREEEQDSKHFLAPAASLDNDFEQYLDKCKPSTKSVLDVGTGMGEQAVFLAQKGFEVTATDVSVTALENGRQLAAFHRATVTFVEDNILDSRLTGQFGLIIDRGCFTILPAGYQNEYFTSIARLLEVDGWLFLKADRKKSNDLAIFSENSCFKTLALYESSYPCINNKVIPAIVLIAQKIC